jgi:hypothetical protein
VVLASGSRELSSLLVVVPSEAALARIEDKGSIKREALNYFAYNFIKIHRTLRVPSAMAVGVTDRLGAWRI